MAEATTSISRLHVVHDMSESVRLAKALRNELEAAALRTTDRSALREINDALRASWRVLSALERMRRT